MIEKFKLGYSNGHEIISQLIHKGYQLKDIQECGILHNNSLDVFNNRLIFPLINKQQHIIGFSGRSIDNTMPKYLNSRETSLFNKSNYLYGEHLLTTNVAYAIIVEGYIDVISAYQIGIKNIVSIMGTSLHEYALNTLFNYVNVIYIMLDNDDAGINAIKRNLPLLCKYITNIKRVYICNLNKYKDIDQLINESTNAMEEINQILNKSTPVINWALNHAIPINMQNMTEEERKITRIEYVKQLCNYIQHTTTKQIYLQTYTKTYKKYKENLCISCPETQLLSLLLQNSDIIENFLEQLLNISFQNKIYEEIRLMLTLHLLYKNDINNILLIINAQFPEQYSILINNVENKYIIINRSFMMHYTAVLFERIKTKSK